MSEKSEYSIKVDQIEADTYSKLKSFGFRKYGRTMHRFVDNDISQVVNFQMAFGDCVCVNIGIRVPECEEHNYKEYTVDKKYYHEYECTFRSRLGSIRGKRETWFDLKKPVARLSRQIISEIMKYVIPMFEKLNSREKLISGIQLCPKSEQIFRFSSSVGDLNLAMMYGKLGMIDRAKEAFKTQYQKTVAEYNDAMVNGIKHFLKKGQRIVYMNQDITATKTGYYTVYGMSHGHIDFLEEIARKLEFEL